MGVNKVNRHKDGLLRPFCAPKREETKTETSEHLRLSSDLARPFLIGLDNLNYKQPVHRSPTVLACHRLNGPTGLNEPTRYLST